MHSRGVLRTKEDGSVVLVALRTLERRMFILQKLTTKKILLASHCKTYHMAFLLAYLGEMGVAVKSSDQESGNQGF